MNKNKKKKISEPIISRGSQRRGNLIRKGLVNRKREEEASIKKGKKEKEDKKKADALQYYKDLKIRAELDEQITKEKEEAENKK